MRALGPGDPPQIGPFRLLGVLGGGGMGRVYLGRSPEGRNVAVKTVRAELADDRHFRSRFAREVAAARQVHGPFVARVVAAEPHDPTPWMATEYLPGLSLTDAIRDHGPLPEPTVRALVAGLVQALAAVHHQSLVHRDVKPSNVLLTANGPRLIDFGIAHSAADTALTNTGTALGTPGFMAPEQLISSGPPVTGAVDIYALGGLIVYALTGSGPFGTTDAQILMFRTVHEEPHLEELSGELRALAQDCLAKLPDQRPSLDELTVRAGAPEGYDGWLPGPLTTQLLRQSTQLLEQAHQDPAGPSGGQSTDPLAPPPGPPLGTPPPTAPGSPPGPRPGASPYPNVASWPTYPGPPPGAPTPPPRGGTRRGLLIGLGAALVVGGGGGTVAWLSGREDGKSQGGPTTTSPTESPTGSPSSSSGSSAPGLPAQVPSEIRKLGKLTIGSALNYEPLNFSEDGQPAGLEVDLAHAIGKQLDLETRVQQVPYEALVPMLRSGSADAVMSAQIDGTQTGFHYVDYFGDGRALIVRKGNPEHITRFADLSRKRVAVVPNSFDMEYLANRAGYLNLTIVPLPDYNRMIDAVEKGEVDAFLLAQAGSEKFLKDNPGRKLEVGGVVWDEPYLYGIMLPESSRGDTAFPEVLRKALNALIANGEYGRILDRWGQEKGAVREATINGSD